MTEKNYDIIVIGAGCGGLTAAACAAKEGKKVLLLERHNAPGGFSSSFVRGRFEFDISLHELCRFSNEAGLGELRVIFDSLGISDKIQWTTIPEAFRLISRSYDGSKIDATMPFGVESFIETMEQYPKRCLFYVFSEEKLNQFNIQLNGEYIVKFDINAREYNGRWYNDLRAWSVTPAQAQQAQQAPQADTFRQTGASEIPAPVVAPPAEPTDSLPF